MVAPIRPSLVTFGSGSQKVDIPCIRLRSWWDYLLTSRPTFVIGGFRIGSMSQLLLETYWGNLQQSMPYHAFYTMFDKSDWPCIPFYLHMDEGVGQRKMEVLVIALSQGGDGEGQQFSKWNKFHHLSYNIWCWILFIDTKPITWICIRVYLVGVFFGRKRKKKRTRESQGMHFSISCGPHCDTLVSKLSTARRQQCMEHVESDKSQRVNMNWKISHVVWSSLIIAIHPCRFATFLCSSQTNAPIWTLDHWYSRRETLWVKLRNWIPTTKYRITQSSISQNMSKSMYICFLEKKHTLVDRTYVYTR